MDALHVACAERAQCCVMLTTDDRLLTLARRPETDVRVEVANPLDWMAERR
jgi:predicted nucleic acid-binding protein